MEQSKRHAWWQRWILLPASRVLVSSFLAMFGPVRANGSYRIPETGGVLIVANHQSDLDPVLVQWACRRPMHFMAKQELFEMPILGPLIRLYGAYPVRRGEPDIHAIRQTLELLSMGEVVLIFPEGRLTQDGVLIDFEAGVALLARRAGVSTICCGIQNSNAIMPYGISLPRRAKVPVQVQWGEVMRFNKEQTNDEVVAHLQSTVQSLLG
ncbi:MAG: lysophospholipid acyltransferase family protein [Fimbriimonas sp.]